MSQHKHIEGTGKPLKVVAPEGCKEYLTARKEYEVIYADFPTDYTGYQISFISDTGMRVIGNERNSSHLNGGNWIVTEREQL